METLRIFDTSLRDGEQSPGYSMTTPEKIRLAVQLEKLGVDVIEAGFPAASPDDFQAVQSIANRLKTAEVCGLARVMESDITATWEAIKTAKKPRIHTFIATSPLHMKYKLKKTESEILQMTEKSVKLARSLCNRVDFSPEDAGRSDRNFLKKVVECAIECGADVINIPDTVGYLTPNEFGDLIQFLIQNCKGAKNITFSTHCHNDLGLAVANSLSGVENGARQVECTINGIGERAGNAALEEVVMAIKTRPHFYEVKTNIETREIMATSQLLRKITGQPVQPNKAIVGRNAFAHESGIHQHGFLSHRETYEIMKPEDVGLSESNIVLGKHSGRAALQSHLEKLGYEVSPEQLKEIFIRFKTLADKKKEIEDADLDALMLGEQEKNPCWTLIDVEITCGTKNTPHADIVLKSPEEEEKKASSTGTGPVDAAYKAIEEIVGKHGTLTDYRMDSVTEGLNAQAIVSLTLQRESGKRFFGRSGNTDIIVASINAYLDALEKCLHRSEQEERWKEGI